MYHVELSEAALNDLHDFTQTETEEIYQLLLSLQDTPTPSNVQTISLPDATEGDFAYQYETLRYRFFYILFEAESLIKVVAIFKKISLN